MKKTFYKKEGRRYIPVSEYDIAFLTSFPKGAHLIISVPGGQSTHCNIDPNYAAMIAAGKVAEDAICSAIIRAGEIQPQKKLLTEEQRAAWMNLIEVWGDSANSLTRPAIRDIAEAGVKAMELEAEKLMQHPSVKEAWDHFQTIAKLCYAER